MRQRPARLPVAVLVVVAGTSLLSRGQTLPATEYIAFRVDDKPVSLLVAPDARVPDAPRWSALGKRVRWQVDPETGAKLLSWTNSGQAYTLVSELPGGGQRACLVCHTDPRRRALIASLDSELSPR